MAKAVLNNWGVRSGDFGNIVFNLIDAGQMRKTKKDRREDFDNVFDFEAALVRDFKITPSARSGIDGMSEQITPAGKIEREFKAAGASRAAAADRAASLGLHQHFGSACFWPWGRQFFLWLGLPSWRRL